MQVKTGKEEEKSDQTNFYQYEVFLRFSVGKAVGRLAGEERRSVLTG